QVSAVIAVEGTAKAKTWIEGIKRNARVYQDNNAILQAINRGQVDTGIVYHASWFRTNAESTADTAHLRIHYFAKWDPGAFLALAGAGVLKSAPDKTAAARFIEFLASVQGQNDLATVKDYEYPLNPKAAPDPVLKPISTLGAPQISPEQLGGL